jgi:hypothetical protein
MHIAPTTRTFVGGDPSWLGSAHGTDSTETITVDTTQGFVRETHFPNGFIPQGTPIGKNTSTKTYGFYNGLTNEVQTVTFAATTGGTFTLTWAGETTSAVAWGTSGPSAATVQAALVALHSITADDITVTGSAGGPYTATFRGQYAGTNVAQMTSDASSLTSGTTATITHNTTTAGGAAASTGIDVLAGHLYTDLHVADGVTAYGAALLTHGKVREARLPFPVDSNGKADVARSIRYI